MFELLTKGVAAQARNRAIPNPVQIGRRRVEFNLENLIKVSGHRLQTSLRRVKCPGLGRLVAGRGRLGGRSGNCQRHKYADERENEQGNDYRRALFATIISLN